MPRWSLDREAAASRHPDERWSGNCSRAIAAILIRYDHHTVWLEGRQALLLTYHWNAAPLDEQIEPLQFTVSFTFARGHPAAPPDVQSLVAGLGLRAG
jgi:hypothetical protein